MKTRFVSATEFKAHCLALLDEVNEQGGTITVTKRGKPVATVGPAKREKWKSPAGIFAGKMKIVGDIINFDMGWDLDHEADLVNAPAAKKKGGR
jgi:prevent-host-death family protein